MKADVICRRQPGLIRASVYTVGLELEWTKDTQLHEDDISQTSSSVKIRVSVHI